MRLDSILFGETQARVIITTSSLDAIKVIERAKLLGITAAAIGAVGGDNLVIKTPNAEISCPVSELHDLWWNSIARIMSE